MHNITDYLLLPEQARWAKEKGFDGECTHFAVGEHTLRHSEKLIYNHDHPYFNTKVKYDWQTSPTFEQFFDWVEEKWGITVSLPEKSADGNWYWKQRRYPDKRSAYIARVDAFIKYIDNLKK